MTQRWGASPQDWMQFDLMLGLTEDLLPVVSNPNGEISPLSKMKGLGKTPSVYNAQRKVVGIPDWTAKKATGGEVERWSKEEDYGICIQTRRVRAIDIDISSEDDARSVADFMRVWLGGRALPTRRRANSGKSLLAFTLTDGDYAKRHFRTATGLVEFLATGQQFVAVGTHPSGARYEWEGGVPDSFPSLTGQEFEALWAALVERFAVEPATSGKGVARKPKLDDMDVVDPLYEWLAENALALDYGSEGQAFIECPWKDGHSSDSGVTETAYFPKGGRGYERGHFKCLHASCAARTDSEFEDALGYRMTEIEALPAVVETGEPEPLPFMERKPKTGRLLATLPNLRVALMRGDMFGYQLRYDTFFASPMIARYGSGVWHEVTDAHELMLRDKLQSEHGFEPIGKELMRDAVNHVANLCTFDTAQHWLSGLRWDGVPRVENYFHKYLGVADSAYTRGVSRYIWTAMAGRVMVPGIKADMVPVLVGGEGLGKSSAVQAMVPNPCFFTEIDLAHRDADLARLMRGKLIGEIGELKGMKKADKEAVKAFITRLKEEWVEKYQSRVTAMPRRIIFLGTTNIFEFLDDPVGGRRWLPMEVGKILVDLIKADLLQLWAEALVMFDVGGVDWSVSELASAERENYRERDTWDEVIREWLYTPVEGDGTRPVDTRILTTREVLTGALGMADARVTRHDAARVEASLGRLGYVRYRTGVKRGWRLNLQ